MEPVNQMVLLVVGMEVYLVVISKFTIVSGRRV